MYICKECWEVFEEPKVVKDPIGVYMGETAYEEWAVCQFCGESCIEEGVLCDCGDYTPTSEPLCRKCKAYIKNGLGTLTEDLGENGINFLYELMEEKYG